MNALGECVRVSEQSRNNYSDTITSKLITNELNNN